MGRGNHAVVARDGILLSGGLGHYGKKRAERLARLANRVFELREGGMTVKNIARTIPTTVRNVESILRDGENVRNRLSAYQEELRAMSPQAITAIRETLSSTSPGQAGDRLSTARWLLEVTKVVGKESPVNIFVGNGAQVNVSNDTVEAARQVAALMKASVPALPEANIVEGEVIQSEQENCSDEHIEGAVGIDPGGDTGGS